MKLILFLSILSCSSLFSQSDSIIDGSNMNGTQSYCNNSVSFINNTGSVIKNAMFSNMIVFELEPLDTFKFFYPVNNPPRYIRGEIESIDIDNGNWIWHCIQEKCSYSNKVILFEIVISDSPFTENKKRLTLIPLKISNKK